MPIVAYDGVLILFIFFTKENICPLVLPHGCPKMTIGLDFVLSGRRHRHAALFA